MLTSKALRLGAATRHKSLLPTMNSTRGPFGLFLPTACQPASAGNAAVTGQWNRSPTTGGSQFLDCAIQHRMSSVGASMSEAPGANTNRVRNPTPSSAGGSKVRLKWKDHCWRIITQPHSGETTLTMPLPAFTLYLLPSLQNRKTMHIKRSLLFLLTLLMVPPNYSGPRWNTCLCVGTTNVYPKVPRGTSLTPHMISHTCVI